VRHSKVMTSDRPLQTQLEVNLQDFGQFTLLTSYKNSLVKLLVCVKSYELREGSTVNEVKVAKTGLGWKFEFCREMSLALEVLALVHL
jgi:hypothetical protein